MTKSRVIRLAVAGAIVAAIAWFAIPWVLINVIRDDPPAKYSLDQLDATTTVG
jgi:hypothetical protein